MTCSACSAHVEKAVRKVQGVQNVTVNLLTNSMVVEADDSLSPQAVTAAVEKAGYGFTLRGRARPRRHSLHKRKKPCRTADGRHEKAAGCLLCISCAADVYFHGKHGRPAAAGLSHRH
ncbi:MAG: heavy-metal-associated domain-containing protein [Ruthenibacterium sp.]